ncbi:MAG: hypothetical protein ACLP05_08060 [Candidatus Kryptoniota bacterium]
MRTPSYRNESSWSKIEEKWDVFRSKVGWGWIVILYIFFGPQTHEGYGFGTIGEIEQLIGCIVALTLYFVLRQKAFKKIEKLWLRSLICGVLSIVLVWIVIIAVNVALIKSSAQ